MITIACVLKSGGVYTPEHVRILESMVSRNLDGIDRFVCLTDLATHPYMEVCLPHVEIVQLAHGWPGSWSKLELFRPTIFQEGEHVLYFDLATVITGNLSMMASEMSGRRRATFFACRRESAIPDQRLSSQVMLWTAGDLDDAYSVLARNPQRIMETAKSPDVVISRYAPKPHYWQDVLPGQVEAYSCNMLPPTKQTRVVTFTLEKPWSELHRDWIREHYTVEVPA